MKRLAILAVILLAAIPAVASGKSNVDNPPPHIRRQATADAFQYWKGEDGASAFRALRNVEIEWTVADICPGAAGCAYVGGCTTLPEQYCKMYIYGAGYYKWGYDWLVGVMKHEMGHLLGYHHGDPTCTMNVDYC